MQTLEQLRNAVIRIERGSARKAETPACVRFGIDAIDRLLPHSGLLGGALHEVLGQGADSGPAALPSLLVGQLLAAASKQTAGGQVLWAMRGRDLFAPALSAVGLHPDRLILVEAGAAVLDVMEEALRHPGLLGVVGEVDGRLGLTASRRLQLAAEASGAIGFAIRRSPRADDPALTAPSAAVSRWRVAALAPGTLAPGTLATGAGAPASRLPRMLGPAVWRIELLRCRGAAAHIPLPTHWIVERCNETGRLSLAGALADGPTASRFPTASRLPSASRLSG